MVRRFGKGLTATFIGLTAFWLLALVVLPNLIMFHSSFRPYLPVEEWGGPRDVYTIANYATFLSTPYEICFTFPTDFCMSPPIHVWVFVKTVFFSAMVTMIALFLAYPAAYYMAKIASSRSAPTLFMLLLIPMLVSEILRSFAWRIILDYQGALNGILKGLGLTTSGIRYIVSYNGVIIGLVYAYILFMLLPIYGSIQSLDSNQIEAGQDLGASTWRIHRRIVIPHAKPGIASGCVMVFMLSAGSILVPTLMASNSSPWFTQIVQQFMFDGNDWNTGSAYAFLLLVLCTGFVTVMMKIFRVGLADIAK